MALTGSRSAVVILGSIVSGRRVIVCVCACACPCAVIAVRISVANDMQAKIERRSIGNEVFGSFGTGY